MKRQATKRKNDIYDPYSDRPHVTVKGLILPLCVVVLANLAILLAWCNA